MKLIALLGLIKICLDLSISTLQSATSKSPLMLPLKLDTKTQLLLPSISLQLPITILVSPLTELAAPAITLLNWASCVFNYIRYFLVSQTLFQIANLFSCLVPKYLSTYVSFFIESPNLDTSCSETGRVISTCSLREMSPMRTRKNTQNSFLIFFRIYPSVDSNYIFYSILNKEQIQNQYFQIKGNQLINQTILASLYINLIDLIAKRQLLHVCYPSRLSQSSRHVRSCALYYHLVCSARRQLLSLSLVTIYANVQKKQIIDQASEGLVNQGLVALYVVSIVFLLLGITGLYGSVKGGSKSKGNTCMMGIYSIGIFVFFVLFVAGTFFFYLGPQAIFGVDCKAGSKTTLIADLYKFSSDVSDNYFCKQQCTCYVQNGTDYTFLNDRLVSNGFTNITRVDSNQASQYQQCKNQVADAQSSMLLMASLEKLLNCGGWCEEDTKFYRFRDINECYTEECLNGLDACHTAFEDFMKGKGQTVGLGCIFAALVCLLNVVTVCCICCHPSKKSKKQNFYSKMLDTES